jgi:hypothetical protein
MLDLFEKSGQWMKSNFRFNSGSNENHPVLLNTKKIKKPYVKEQPVKLDMSLEEAIKLALKTPIKKSKIF